MSPEGETSLATSAATSGPITGLDFPSNGQTSTDIRFCFTGSNLIPMYPATYVWRVNLRRQTGYYATFFRGPQNTFTGLSYYGAHPYPDGDPKITSREHKWGLSQYAANAVTDANGHSTQLGYDIWRTQALRVFDNGVNKVHEFYWDLPDTTKVIRVLLHRSYGSPPPPNPALTFGAAPWSPTSERLSGILRGIQLYSAALSLPTVLQEADAPLSSPDGAANVWYLNVNPTPGDISDRSGRGHHPKWVGSGRAALWTQDGTEPAPTVSLSADPGTVNSGSSSTLTWTSANASTCAAGGAWSGDKALSGSQSTGPLSATSTFTLACTGPGGTTSQSVTVTVTSNPPGGLTGLDFPSNGQTSTDIRFRFTGSNLIPMYPATYVWRVNLRQQSGYYTTFFWGPQNQFTGTSYFGAHPYPDGEPKPTSRSHKWSLAIYGTDVVNDANGHSTQLGYDIWRTQALRVFDNGVNKVHEFYWDLPDTTKVIRVLLHREYGTPPPVDPALTFGDAPWAPGSERLSGILRGIQLYSAVLSLPTVLQEADSPLSSPAGAANVWYLNVNPTPSDISDKSGRGHHPQWVGSGRAALWTGP